MSETERLGPPTKWELAMAMKWEVLNIARTFHHIPGNDITEVEQKFLEVWRSIPAKRRQAALDFEIPSPDREEKLAKMRRALA